MRSTLPAMSPTCAFSWRSERRRRDSTGNTSLPCALPEPVLGERAQLRVTRRAGLQHVPPGQRDDALGARSVLEQDGLAGAGQRRVEPARAVRLQPAGHALGAAVAVDEHAVARL